MTTNIIIGRAPTVMRFERAVRVLSWSESESENAPLLDSTLCHCRFSYRADPAGVGSICRAVQLDRLLRRRQCRLDVEQGAAGGGIAGTVPNNPHLTWKVEYLHVDLGSINFSFTAPGGGVASVSGRFSDDIVRVGADYHF